MRRLLFLALIFISLKSIAQQADNGDGTYTNPVIWADFPDNDVIRVGNTYYMVATTMYFFPGVPILKSKDLVNWEYAADAIPAFKQNPAYDLAGGSRYGHGQWASSLRYHKGLFYILFVTLDEGGFLCTAKNAEGPWELHKLPKAYYDSGLFFDDDGKIYVVHGYSKLSLTQVDQNLAPISKDSVIFDRVQRKGLEGSHVYKINGYYYIYATYGGGDGYQIALRSKNIYGPYEEKVVLKDDMNLTGKGVHQGALVQTQTGEWWSIIFQDRDGVGRVPTLQPVTWVDGWPMVGENGRAIVTHKKPNVGKNWPVKQLPTSDDFNSPKLGLQWSWNHNPDAQKWSLAARKGFIRLKTATVTNDLLLARNTLTQRIFGPYSNATISFDLSHMQNNDVCGLAVLQIPYASIAVKNKNGSKTIVMNNNGTGVDSINLNQLQKVYFKAEVNTLRDQAAFFYSTDNIDFKPLGDTLNLKFNLKMFTGNRFAIFNYAQKQTGGYVDADWFKLETRQGAPNHFFADAKIEAEMFDRIYKAKTQISLDSTYAKDQDLTENVNGAWFKFNNIDFGKGYAALNIRLAAVTGSKLTIYVDNQTQPYAMLTINATGSWKNYQTLKFPVKPIKGKHALTFKFTGGTGNLANINWFGFKKNYLN